MGEAGRDPKETGEGRENQKGIREENESEN